jgi:lactate dehydrogenase-like 2-hydroxyacid dehydrogenase
MGPMRRWSWDKCRYGEELLSKIAGRGVHVPVTRTIGMDHIDLDAAARLGIAVGNAHYAPDSVADFSLMLMLVALRHCKAAVCQQNVNDYSLRGLEGRTLSSLAVSVVGTGAIDAAVMQRLSGFGCEILATGHHVNTEVAKRAAYVSQDELFRASDVISFHVPATPANHHLASRESLAEMKDGAVLVNAARPDLMDVSALAEGIEAGKIGALAMDVFEGEQGICHFNRSGDILRNRDMACLRQFLNTVLAQHMAFCMAEAIEEMAETAVAKALSSSRAEAPEAIDGVPKG